jgi:hypothetical protein
MVIKGKILKSPILKDMMALLPSMIALDLSKLTFLTYPTPTRVIPRGKVEWACMKKVIAV